MTAPVIGFIGAGNMATSLIGGMLQKNVKPANLIASDSKPEQCAALERQFQIRTSTDNAVLAAECDVLLLAVKPQVMQDVCRALPRERKPGQPLQHARPAGVACAKLANVGPHFAFV